jgi:hypothetical protein
MVGLLIFMAASSLALADSTPPDGKVSVAGGGISYPLTSFTTSIPTSAITTCPSTGTLPTDCTLFGTQTPQYVLGLINETGYASSILDITLNFSSFSEGEQVVNCDGGSVFQYNNCGTGLPLSSGGTVAIDFSQGDGTGIGCYDTSTEANTAANAACEANNAAAAASGSAYQTVIPFPGNSPLSPCPTTPAPGVIGAGATAVCGPAEFVIGFGTDGDLFPADATITGVTVTIVPEPSSLLLLLAGLIMILPLTRLRNTVTA